MDKFELRRQALVTLRDSLGRGAITHIAQRIGVEPSYVSRMLYPEGKSGRKRIGEDIVERLDEHFSGWMGQVIDSSEVIPAPDRWLPAPGYVRLEHLSPHPSMGSSAITDESAQVVQYLDVLESWVRENIGTTNPSRIKVLTGKGSSMSPTINDGDLVFVDVGCRKIEVAGIYVIDAAGRLILKKSMILSDGTLIVRSDNTSEYPDEERFDLKKSGDSIVVCGKVLAWWTLRKG